MAVREDIHGRLVEKAATDFDLHQPAGRSGPSAPASRRRTATGTRCPSGSSSRTSPSRASLFRREVVDGDRAARRVVLHLLRRRRLRPARPPRGLPDLGGPRRGAGAPARLRPAARPRRAGRASTCTATSSSCTSATARTRWSAPSPTLIARGGGRAQPAARRAGGGRQRDPRHPQRPGHALDSAVRAPGSLAVDWRATTDQEILTFVQARPRRRRLRLLRPHHRRTVRQRARPATSSSSSDAPTSAATPTARPTPRPASRCTCTARTSSTPPTSGCGSTSTGSRRSPTTSTASSASYHGQVYSLPMNLGADQPVLRPQPHPRRGARPDRRAGQRDRHRPGRRTSRRRRSA